MHASSSTIAPTRASRLEFARTVLLGLAVAVLGTGLFTVRDRPWLALTLIWAGGIAMILIVRRISWRINVAHVASMRASARQDERTPLLVLRSFERTGLAFRPRTYADTRLAPGVSYLQDIATVLAPVAPLIAIGSPDDTEDLGVVEDRVLYFQSSDRHWPEMFRKAAEAARAVIVIPGATPNLIREIRELKEGGALSKVIAFMPATPIGKVAKWIVRYESTETIARKWDAARLEWRTVGVALPPYEGRGMIFDIDDHGNPANEVRLDGQVLTVNLTPLRQLAKDKPCDASRPLSSLIPELERLEVPRARPGLFREIGRFLGLGY